GASHGYPKGRPTGARGRGGGVSSMERKEPANPCSPLLQVGRRRPRQRGPLTAVRRAVPVQAMIHIGGPGGGTPSVRSTPARRPELPGNAHEAEPTDSGTAAGATGNARRPELPTPGAPQYISKPTPP